MLEKEDINLFLNTLKNVSKYDLSDYSEKSLTRRINKILVDNGINLKALIFKIKSNKDFVEKVIKDITVNTTDLFRDVKVWHKIRYNILPELAKLNNINIFHAGVSTGQEIYSMLILLNELNLLEKSNVYGVDINSDVINRAKEGIYRFRFNLNYLDNFDDVINKNPYNFEENRNVSIDKYFDIDRKTDTIQVKKFIRDKANLAVADLVKNPNKFYKKYDLILCRNVLIYFNQNLQTKIINDFYNMLYDKSYLVLGLHESILHNDSKFKKKQMFYIKK